MSSEGTESWDDEPEIDKSEDAIRSLAHCAVEHVGVEVEDKELLEPLIAQLQCIAESLPRPHMVSLIRRANYDLNVAIDMHFAADSEVVPHASAGAASIEPAPASVAGASSEPPGAVSSPEPPVSRIASVGDICPEQLAAANYRTLLGALGLLSEFGLTPDASFSQIASLDVALIRTCIENRMEKAVRDARTEVQAPTCAPSASPEVQDSSAGIGSGSAPGGDSEVRTVAEVESAPGGGIEVMPGPENSPPSECKGKRPADTECLAAGAKLPRVTTLTL
eukprot:CAMPEP_0114563938 /NCGR_PEP_ID=MMETSP0114-20121206/13412_1 /TAXON_ID=31324 /ORGANISM="Goniomonas sp, Strain m" /LENGTH=278 /DNA_ID=CAMNT_0001749889 /DNA_START=50 /DNA_END=886 /DNA_ORIENTATION=+